MTGAFPQVRDLITAELASSHLFRAVPEILPDSDLADLGVDTLDRIGIGLKVEERFGFVVSDQDEAGWATVADIVRMVEERGRAAA